MLNVSIVIYKQAFSETEGLIRSLLSSKLVHKLFIIDNSPTPLREYKIDGVHYTFTGKNIGYGAGHNIALRKSIKEAIPYHLVVNPDISLNSDIFKEMLDYLNTNQDVGLLMPKVLNTDGSLQYLCKLLPTPMDLLLRRFLPASCFRNRQNRFEMRNSGYHQIMEVPYLSGCFMLLRTEILEKTGLFDERFFLYPEDIDLTRRIYTHYKTIFYPHVHVVHKHEKGSYKSLKMMLIHVYNMMKYFNKWGWIYDKERKTINQKLIKKWDL